MTLNNLLFKAVGARCDAILTTQSILHWSHIWQMVNALYLHNTLSNPENPKELHTTFNHSHTLMVACYWIAATAALGQADREAAIHQPSDHQQDVRQGEVW